MVSWLIMQVAETVFPALHLPDWTVTLIVVLLIIGFPVALIITWGFELTPDGIKRTEPASADELSEIAHAGRPKLEYLLIALLVLGMAYLFYERRAEHPTVSEAQPGAAISSIAVLPFVDMSAGKDQEYFCDGMAEELLNSLAQLSVLKVIARTSSFSFKGKEEDISSIGRQLGVESILEGSVRKSGNRVRITAQLIRLPEGVHLWSDTYDRTLDDIFAVQEDISRQVVDALKVTLLGAEDSSLAERPTGNIRAYDLYLLGLHNLNGAWILENTNRAIDFFSRATELDSSYALAWAGLADAYIRQSRNSNVPRDQALKSAENAASRALELDSLLAEAHAAYGWVKDWQFDFPAADAEFHRAIELNPNYMPAYSRYSHLLQVQGQFKDSEALLEQTLEIDPLSTDIKDSIRWALSMMGRFEESDDTGTVLYRIYSRLDQALRKQLALVNADPANAVRYLWLSGVYLDLGEYELAEKSFARAGELAPDMVNESGEVLLKIKKFLKIDYPRGRAARY